MGNVCCDISNRVENSEKLVDLLGEELPGEKILSMRKTMTIPVNIINKD